MVLGVSEEGGDDQEAAGKMLKEGRNRILVSRASETATQLETLLCERASFPFNLSEYREEIIFEVKMISKKGRRTTPPQQRIFKKGTAFSGTPEVDSFNCLIPPLFNLVEVNKLEWLRETHPPWSILFAVVGGRLEGATSVYRSAYLCRYRCLPNSGADCPGHLSGTSNGSTVYKSIDKTVGFVSFTP